MAGILIGLVVVAYLVGLEWFFDRPKADPTKIR